MNLQCSILLLPLKKHPCFIDHFRRDAQPSHSSDFNHDPDTCSLNAGKTEELKNELREINEQEEDKGAKGLSWITRRKKWDVQKQLEVMVMRKICREGDEKRHDEAKGNGSSSKAKKLLWSINESGHPEEAFGAVSYISFRSAGFVEEVDKLFITWSLGFHRGKKLEGCTCLIAKGKQKLGRGQLRIWSRSHSIVWAHIIYILRHVTKSLYSFVFTWWISQNARAANIGSCGLISCHF